MTLGEYFKTIDLKKYDRVICKHDGDLIVVYENGQMRYSVENSQSKVIGDEIEKFNFGVELKNLIIEVD